MPRRSPGYPGLRQNPTQTHKGRSAGLSHKKWSREWGGSSFNTYPNYFVRIIDNSTFTLNKSTGFNAITTLDTVSLTGVSSASTYNFIFSAIDNGANVDLSAQLLENGVSRGSLSFTDTSSVLTGGYVGIAGGAGSVNNNSFEGIVISEFQVASTVIIPEPSSLALLLISGLTGFLFFRKHKR